MTHEATQVHKDELRNVLPPLGSAFCFWCKEIHKVCLRGRDNESNSVSGTEKAGAVALEGAALARLGNELAGKVSLSVRNKTR